MSVKFYRKKPIPVGVIQFNGENGKKIVEWSGGKIRGNHVTRLLEIQTLEGKMTADINYYLVKGPGGEFWGVKPEIFEATYEAV